MTLRFSLIAAVAIVAVAAPAAAQRQSLGYQFLDGVKKRDGNAVNKVITQPGVGSAVLDYQADGQAAIHIVTRDGDTQYLSFILSRGANPDLRNGAGATPLIVAVDENQPACIEILVKKNAKIDLGNRSGETPLIRAVQNHNFDIARLLLSLGANPDQSDIIAGKSARDYAALDAARFPAIAKLIADAPKQVVRKVSGPTLR